MFSNGKFKNVVADEIENHQVKPSDSHRKEYSLLPKKGEPNFVEVVSIQIFIIYIVGRYFNHLIKNVKNRFCEKSKTSSSN